MDCSFQINVHVFSPSYLKNIVGKTLSTNQKILLKQVRIKRLGNLESYVFQSYYFLNCAKKISMDVADVLLNGKLFFRGFLTLVIGSFLQ